MDTWKSRYRNTINYLSKILFPVFENYFFCALWNIIKNANKNYFGSNYDTKWEIIGNSLIKRSTNISIELPKIE